MNKSGLADNPLFKESETIIKKKLRNQATMTPSNQDEMVASISNSIREVGKKASTYRLTNIEKIKMAKIIFSFRARDMRISENDIVRIGIHFLYADFKHKNDKNILGDIIHFRER